MCFSPAWAPTDVSGVLCLEFRLWGKEELSEGRGWVFFLPTPSSAASHEDIFQPRLC